MVAFYKSTKELFQEGLKNQSKKFIDNLNVEIKSLKLTINVANNEVPRALLRVLIDHVLDNENEERDLDDMVEEFDNTLKNYKGIITPYCSAKEADDDT